MCWVFIGHVLDMFGKSLARDLGLCQVCAGHDLVKMCLGGGQYPCARYVGTSNYLFLSCYIACFMVVRVLHTTSTNKKLIFCMYYMDGRQTTGTDDDGRRRRTTDDGRRRTTTTDDGRRTPTDDDDGRRTTTDDGRRTTDDDGRRPTTTDDGQTTDGGRRRFF